MTAISSWKGMAEMPKFKSSAPRGYGLWMSHYFFGEEAGGQHILSCLLYKSEGGVEKRGGEGGGWGGMK